MWQLAYGLLVVATAVGGLRRRQQWAWLGLWSVPLVLLLQAFMAPWTWPVLLIPQLAAVAGLWWSRPGALSAS